MGIFYNSYDNEYVKALFEEFLPMLVEMKQINNIMIPTIKIENIDHFCLNEEEKKYY